MFLAIINDSYVVVKEEMDLEKEDFEVGDYLRRGYNNVLVSPWIRNIRQGVQKLTVRAEFPKPFLCLRHPYLEMKTLRNTSSLFNRYKYQGIVIIGGTPVTSVCHSSSVGNHWIELILTGRSRLP